MKHRQFTRLGATISFSVLLLSVGCICIQNEIPQRPHEPDTSGLAGVWRVTYTNGAIRTYEVGRDDSVRFFEENLRSRLRRRPDVLLEFDSLDGQIERWTLAGKRVFVEHYNPASLYPDQPPLIMGAGVRIH